MSDDDREFLTVEEALTLLPDGDVIHVYTNPGANILVGADWTRDDVEEAIRQSERRERSGPQAQKMGYGLAVQKGNRDRDCWFIKTKIDG